jgi:hypothetical protein
MDAIAAAGCRHLATLGRMFVYWGLPFGCSFLHLDKKVIFFLRGKSTQDELNAQIARYFEDVPQGAMIVYPGNLA